LKRNLLDSLLCDCNLEGTKIIFSTKSYLLYQKILSRDQSNFFNKKFLTLPKQKNNNMRGQVNFFEAKFLLLHPYTNINHGNQNNFASSKNLLGIKEIFSAKSSFGLSLFTRFLGLHLLGHAIDWHLSRDVRIPLGRVERQANSHQR
jgi:hypothetical protein